MSSVNKVIASNIIAGVGGEWSDFMLGLLENSSDRDIPVDFGSALSPLPKQLRNPAVIRESPDGTYEYVSSQIWLAIDEFGNRTVIEPKETSGVLIDDVTGKVIKTFNELPTVTPDSTKQLIRILIRKGEGSDNTTMSWTLYNEFMD